MTADLPLPEDVTPETIAEINDINPAETLVTLLVLQVANMRSLCAGHGQALTDETIVRHVLGAVSDGEPPGHPGHPGTNPKTTEEQS